MTLSFLVGVLPSMRIPLQRDAGCMGCADCAKLLIPSSRTERILIRSPINATTSVSDVVSDFDTLWLRKLQVCRKNMEKPKKSSGKSIQAAKCNKVRSKVQQSALQSATAVKAPRTKAKETAWIHRLKWKTAARSGALKLQVWESSDNETILRDRNSWQCDGT